MTLVLQVDVGPGRVATGGGGGPSLEARGTASRTCTDDIHLDRDLRQVRLLVENGVQICKTCEQGAAQRIDNGGQGYAFCLLMF